MDYRLMSDKDLIRHLAGKIDTIRIAQHIKESELEELAGISRKTLYNFKQGRGLSLTNFIRLLKALGVVDRLQLLFPETNEYSPLTADKGEEPKRVRDSRNKKTGKSDFLWGDEE